MRKKSFSESVRETVDLIRLIVELRLFDWLHKPSTTEGDIEIAKQDHGNQKYLIAK